jgi:hypothetical protein
MQGSHLAGIVSNAELATLQTSAKTLTAEQLLAVRQTYADAFTEDMKVCAIVSGIGVLFTLCTFRRNPEPVWEVRRRRMAAEQSRLRGLRT